MINKSSLVYNKPQRWPQNETLPPRETHAVSVSMPTWQLVDTYVHKRPGHEALTRGYPRIFVHRKVMELGEKIVNRYGLAGTSCMPLPTPNAVKRCSHYLMQKDPNATLKVSKFTVPTAVADKCPADNVQWAEFYGLMFPEDLLRQAKDYWKQTGDVMSSRRVMMILDMFDWLEESWKAAPPQPLTPNAIDNMKQLLSFQDGEPARRQLATRIANIASSDKTGPVTTKDVFLYPTGMCAIYATSLACRDTAPKEQGSKAVVYGFPYTDTPKVMTRNVWSDCTFYGFGSAKELDELETRLESGFRIRALFTEFPTNPLLDAANLERIRSLADRFGFIVCVDDTVGTLVNVNLFPYVDVVMTSLTKIFSGVGNVMGGSVVVNPNSPHHGTIHGYLDAFYENTYFPPDVEYMAHNTSDVVPRIQRINNTADHFAHWFSEQPLIEKVFYPSMVGSKPMFDKVMKPGGGYGYLLTLFFYDDRAAIAFHDALEVAQGPSLGFNFTLATAYTLLGHHDELPWAAQFGISEFLVRLSIGLEEWEDLERVFVKAFEAAEKAIEHGTTVNKLKGLGVSPSQDDHAINGVNGVHGADGHATNGVNGVNGHHEEHAYTSGINGTAHGDRDPIELNGTNDHKGMNGQVNGAVSVEG